MVDGVIVLVLGVDVKRFLAQRGAERCWRRGGSVALDDLTFEEGLLLFVRGLRSHARFCGTDRL